jgi:hypothetical protein
MKPLRTTAEIAELVRPTKGAGNKFHRLLESRLFAAIDCALDWCLIIFWLGLIVSAAMNLTSCTIAPRPIVPTVATPGANGQANSGILAPQARDGAQGWHVDATIPAAYAALLPKYGARLDTPSLPVEQAFVALGDGTFWCGSLTLYHYGLMHFWHLQDATLQSPDAHATTQP